MSKNFSDYVKIQNNIRTSLSGDKFRLQKQLLSSHILNVGYDYIDICHSQSMTVDRGNLEKYIWSNLTLTHKDVGFSFLFYYIIVKILINWIVDQIIERILDEET